MSEEEKKMREAFEQYIKVPTSVVAWDGSRYLSVGQHYSIANSIQRDWELWQVCAAQSAETIARQKEEIEMLNGDVGDLQHLLEDMRKRHSVLQSELSAFRESAKNPVAEKSENGIEWQFADTVERLPVGEKLMRIPATKE